MMKKSAGLIALAAVASMSWASGDGDAVLKQTLEHYQSLKGVSVTMKLDIQMEEGIAGGPMMADSMSQVAHGVLLRPNIFAFWPQVKENDPMAAMGMVSPTVYSNGKQVISAIASKKIYETSPAPESFAAMIGGDENVDEMSAWQMIVGAEVVLELMSVDSEIEVADHEDHAGHGGQGADDDEEAAGILELLEDADYKGIEGEGQDAHHVFLVENPGEEFDGISFEVFVSATGKPWVTALKPQMDDLDTGMPEGMTVTMRFNDWTPADAVPSAAMIVPGEDWKKVDSLMDELMGGGMVQEDAPEPPAPAKALGEGDKAANFTLDTLGGPSFTLADNQGKVVVLDFWATWCGPCVAGLPVVTKVMRDYADKGVVFVAVNLRESPDKVSAFMNKKKWNFTVAFDSDGAIANKYGVTGIPHSVIVDQKGVIHSVHVGFGGAEATDKMLREELDGLIGG
jgi:thiol-disulfide isomerase/thioredoxin